MPIFNQPLVYVAHDDQDNHPLLTTLFAKRLMPYTIRYFHNGSELITQLTHHLDNRLPDLILLDLQLPILTGYEVLQLLKQDSDWKHIPVIIYSSSVREADRKRCLHLGYSAFWVTSNTFLKHDTFINTTIPYPLIIHEN